MAIELSKPLRAEALASLERYLSENFEERVGNIAAGALLSFFIEEVGPSIYNQAVADVQERLARSAMVVTGPADSMVWTIPWTWSPVRSERSSWLNGCKGWWR